MLNLAFEANSAVELDEKSFAMHGTMNQVIKYMG